MKKYIVKIDMVADGKSIKEEFTFGNPNAAVSFSLGYAEAMNWFTKTIHEISFMNGYFWHNDEGKVIIKVEDEEGNIVEREDLK